MKPVPFDRQTAILPVTGAGNIAAILSPLPWALAMIPVIAVSPSTLPLLTRMARQGWRVGVSR